MGSCFQNDGESRPISRLSDDVPRAVSTCSDDSVKLDGYRLGAGVETTIQGFIARAEYRYSSYERVAGTKPERHQAALILGYRF